jgi:lysosomal alpha-glucosidase
VNRNDASKTVLFNSSSQPFVFEDQYLQIGTKFPVKDPNIYGLGERTHPLRLNTSNVAYTMFNLDNPSTFRQNLYGSHPFYMEFRNGQFYGVFLLNSNAMDALLTPDTLNFRVTGGVIDMYFFMGPTAESVIQQYQEIIGKPYMPPFWTFGWHQCKYGYKDLNDVKSVVQKYADNKLPLETMWTDIDYMDAYKDFTWDPVRFPLADVKNFANDLHAKGQHYIVIVDPAIAYEQGYAPYDDGVKADIFVKDPNTGKALVNKQWPGLSVFPDFTNPASTAWWQKYVEQFITEVPLDALWLDMNEVSGFCDGVCNTTSRRAPAKGGYDPNNPPFVPDNGGEKHLDFKTIAMDAQHYIGDEYHVHNIYNLYEVNATIPVLEKVRGKRAFIVTRANYPGMGNIAAHWLGDNWSTWESLRLSISGMITMNMFGINMVGADICGFMGNTTMELCARWMQAGSFYPFARNHNTLGSIPQEPYVFGQAFIDMTRNLLATRYSLLAYYYTLFAQAHMGGGSVVKALFFEFPSNHLAAVDDQFLIGRGLMVSPIMKEGARTRKAHFPGSDNWYDFYTGLFLTKGSADMDLYAPLNYIPVHVRGGTIIPKQIPTMTTAELRQSPFELLVALNTSQSAVGHLILDDGDSVGTLDNNQFTDICYVASQSAGSVSLRSNVKVSGYPLASKYSISSVRVYGIQKICQVTVNGKATLNYKIDQENNVLTISDLSLAVTDEFVIIFGC